MTKLLEKAIHEAKKLPVREQNRLAREILVATGSAAAPKLPEKVPPLLAKMVRQVKRDIRDGKTVEMGWDEL